MATKMTLDRAQLILAKLRIYEGLERKNCTDAEWIALAFGVTTNRARAMIAEALAKMNQKART